MSWDPDQYLRFAEERALPFRHLVAAVDHLEPSTVVDLGCGPGKLTAGLRRRWPDARIIGIDSSEEMIEHARLHAESNRLEFSVGDVLTWRVSEPADLMLSNACFHWIDDHRRLFDHLLPQLNEAGVLAFQVPANHTEPSHTILGELCSGPRWCGRLDGLPRTGTREPLWYLAELGSRDLDVSVWQTTYFHVLEGPDQVLAWVRGTTLRPVLERLSAEEHEEFLSEYGLLLGEAYPSRDGKTVFPFKRTFVVATRGGFPSRYFRRKR
jgi:trans-aconitate 2-methyltransferase